MALTNEEESFIKELYQLSLDDKKKKDDESLMWADVEKIMKRKDISEAEKAELRYQRKLEYFGNL